MLHIFKKLFSLDKHSHKCEDCGHVFEHDSRAYDKVIFHMCPKCGKGPWWWRLKDDSSV